jgi:hypothetical protein
MAILHHLAIPGCPISRRCYRTGAYLAVDLTAIAGGAGRSILKASAEHIMMPSMRTTLTLDADVARLVMDAVHEEGRPMKQVVNDALRRALAPQIDRGPVRLVAHRSAVRLGLDLAKLNQLADELEDDDVPEPAHRTA